MPSLDKKEQERLIGPTCGKCSLCRSPIIRQYCRECDEFWFMCDCLSDDFVGITIPHEGHRAYRYINNHIVADSFDKKKRLTDGKKKIPSELGLKFDLRPRPSE
jgi:hypothetical protein